MSEPEKIEYPNAPKVFKAHPKRKDIIQEFHPTITVDEEGTREIKHGKVKANYRPAKKNEKADIELPRWSEDEKEMFRDPYVKTR